MGFQIQESTKMARTQQHFAVPLENRPMLLKDFLRDEASSHSCTRRTTSKPNKAGHIVLLRSWSRKAAATKISAVHKVIKLLQFASSPRPRKLTNKRAKDDDTDILEAKAKVQVKDILRWRSFRDLAEDDIPPLDFDFPPSTTTTSCTKRPSCCHTDFTADELPPWARENEDFSTLKNPKHVKGDWSSFEEYEQQSPVSVLDSPFRQLQDFTHFHPLVENVQSIGAKCCLPQKRSTLQVEITIYEEKARQLLSQIEEDAERDADEDDVMLDFFIDELSRNEKKLNDDEFDCQILRIAKSWMDGEFGESYEWEIEEERGSFVKDMERGFSWNKFEEDRQDLCEELEVGVLNCLLDDLVADFFAR